MPKVSADEFSGRFVTLVLGSRDLPRRPVDFHILLYSSTLGLRHDDEYSEAEVNAELQGWLLRFGQGFSLDHATLRRYLVDQGYLRRDPAGRCYRLQAGPADFEFEPSIRSLDLERLMADARSAREERKRRHASS